MKINILRLFGINVRLHSSWFFLALLVLWTLSAGYFPSIIADLPVATYWLMGLAATVGLFISLLLHELSHSLVAKKMGLTIKNITLFVFGGVAEIEMEPQGAKTEFWMAIAGPVASVLLGGIFLAVHNTGIPFGWPTTTLAVTDYLAKINFFIAAFNMLPGFPLDGGRILRSALWAWKKDPRWATHRAAQAGVLIGSGIFVGGILALLNGYFIVGFWWLLIALFLNTAAKSSEYAFMIYESLKNKPILNYMNTRPISIHPQLTVNEAVQNYFYKFHHRHFPVIDRDELLGVISLRDIKRLPHSQWKDARVADIYTRATKPILIPADAEALKVLHKMEAHKLDFLLVAEGDDLKGIVTYQDLLGALPIQLELEGQKTAS